MPAIIPSANRALVDKLEISFVDECGRLQRVSRPLMLEVSRRATVQFVIDLWQQFVESFGPTFAPFMKKRRNVGPFRGSAVHCDLQPIIFLFALGNQWNFFETVFCAVSRY